MGRKTGIQYEGGTFWRQDDRSGFSTRAGRTKREWTGLIVDEKLWEPRNAQDFVKGVVDDQTVPDARPLPPPVFQSAIYVSLSAAVVIGATFLPLSSIAGLSAGDSIGVMLDVNTWFKTTISGNPTSTGINIASPMPFTAAKGNMVVDYNG